MAKVHRHKRGGLSTKKLYGSCNLTAAKATGACVGMSGRSVNQNLHTLHIGLPHTIGTPMRVTYLNPERNALVTKFTFCHMMPHLLPE